LQEQSNKLEDALPRWKKTSENGRKRQCSAIHAHTYRELREEMMLLVDQGIDEHQKRINGSKMSLGGYRYSRRCKPTSTHVGER
jgi:hypothetical protein